MAPPLPHWIASPKAPMREAGPSVKPQCGTEVLPRVPVPLRSDSVGPEATPAAGKGDESSHLIPDLLRFCVTAALSAGPPLRC